MACVRVCACVCALQGGFQCDLTSREQPYIKNKAPRIWHQRLPRLVGLCSGGLTCAAEEAEQAPWPLPTRCQCWAGLPLGCPNVPWWRITRVKADYGNYI